MKNYIQEGDTITFTAPVGGVVAGLGYLIGTAFVIANASAAAGALFEGDTEGVFDVVKADSQVWTEGAAIYWDNTAKNFTTVSASNTKVGVAVRAVASTAGLTTGRVRLNGSF